MQRQPLLSTPEEIKTPSATKSTPPKKIIIIGAGPAGLFAARELLKNHYTKDQIVIIEKEKNVGGKCSTYSDAKIPELKTERGATLVAHNYGPVIDAMREKKVEFEKNFLTNPNTVNFNIERNKVSQCQKIKFYDEFGHELWKFSKYVKQYYNARNNSSALPTDFELPFAEFAKKNNLLKLNELLKSLVTGFGYGAMEECPAYCVFEYMGLTTLDAMILSNNSLHAIKDGFQHLMEKVAEDFDVRLSATITHIKRSARGVEVTYECGEEKPTTLHGDALVIAIPPTEWKKLGMDLNEVEQQCVEKINYYRYPITVSKIKSLAPQHTYFPAGLEQKGFGHPCLITTRDARTNPAEGRLCTVYVNLAPKDETFTLDQKSLKQDLMKALPDIKEDAIEILETKYWTNYMPTLPWDQRLALEKAQFTADKRTLYVGAYPLGGFEDVACVTGQAIRAVNKHILHRPYQETYMQEISRSKYFFSAEQAAPVGDRVATARENGYTAIPAMGLSN